MGSGASSRIENYLGFPAGLSGGDLSRRAVAQAVKFGVEILTPQEATGLTVVGPYKRITLSDGSEVSCHALMLAMGVSWTRLPAEGAERFTGRGVYYGASPSEALHVKGDTVYMVGAGNSAGQAALFFKDYAGKVIMLVRGESLAAKMSRSLVDRIHATPEIEVRLSTEVTRCAGADRLEELQLRSCVTGDTETVSASHLFAFLGATPLTQWLRGTIACDERGFILTGPDLAGTDALKDWPLSRPPFMLETNVPGVFATGDARAGSIKRVASAVGEGSVAVHFAHRFLAER